MTLSPTPDFAEVVRTISLVGTTPVATDNADPTIKFRCQLSPATERRAVDGSPRESEPRRLVRWSTFVILNPQLTAGGRLLINEDLFEVMTNPKPISRGFRSYGYEAEVVLVDDLYPHVATVTTQDGNVVGVTAVALWSPTERHEDRGDYEDRDGEAPIETSTIIARNASLMIGPERWRVLDATTEVNPPRVTFSARRAGG